MNRSHARPDPPSGALSPEATVTDEATVIDLRPPELRFADPLEKLLPGRTIRPVSLAAIEAGEHGLSAEMGPVLVVCERGLRSSLAVRFLEADGLCAQAYPGGVPALRRAYAALTK